MKVKVSELSGIDMNTEQERTYNNMRKAVMDVITDVHDRAAQIDEAVDEVIGLVQAALQSQYQKDVKRPVLDSIVDEIHRRADKEWADDGYDFEVTITADEYKALCEEEKAIGA